MNIVCRCSCVVSHIGTSSAHAVAKVQAARKHPYGDLFALSMRPLLRPCTGYKTENQKDHLELDVDARHRGVGAPTNCDNKDDYITTANK